MLIGRQTDRQTAVHACRWRDAWRERADGVERVRACITRRRIAFRVFKQWYWESFDEDVQARRCLLSP